MTLPTGSAIATATKSTMNQHLHCILHGSCCNHIGNRDPPFLPTMKLKTVDPMKIFKPRPKY